MRPSQRIAKQAADAQAAEINRDIEQARTRKADAQALLERNEQWRSEDHAEIDRRCDMLAEHLKLAISKEDALISELEGQKLPLTVVGEQQKDDAA